MNITTKIFHRLIEYNLLLFKIFFKIKYFKKIFQNRLSIRLDAWHFIWIWSKNKLYSLWKWFLLLFYKINFLGNNFSISIICGFHLKQGKHSEKEKTIMSELQTDTSFFCFLMWMMSWHFYDKSKVSLDQYE